MIQPQLRRAAILLTCLPEELAASLVAKLEPKQVEAVSIEIAKIGLISGDEQEAVMREFASANPNALLAGSGGLDVAKKIVEKALGDKAGATLDTVREQIAAMPFAFLRKIAAEHLLTFITDEHPQTIALVLSHLPPKQAAAVISGLSPDRQLAVVRRIAIMSQTNPDIIKEVERGLESRMSAMMSQRFDSVGGVPRVAEILNVSDRTTERGLLESMSQDDPDLVEEIRRLMFVFEDIIKYSDKDIQTILKNVETSQWAMALKGQSEPLKDKILGNLSKRAGDLLREEMEFLGAVKSSTVTQAQQAIVDIIRRLEDKGEISLESNSESEQMIA